MSTPFAMTELSEQEHQTLEKYGYLVMALSASEERLSAFVDEDMRSEEQFLYFILDEEVKHYSLSVYLTTPAERQDIPLRLKSALERVGVAARARYLHALEAQDIVGACVEDTVRMVLQERMDALA